MPNPDPSDTEYVQGVERAFAVIRSFSADARALTIAQVAERTKLTRAVARRYLMTLAKLGYVLHDGTKYSPTPRLLELGFAYLSTITVAEVAQPYIERIAKQLNESSTMAVLDGDVCVYVVRVPGRRILTSNLVVGSRVPAHATAIGKVLLAHLTEEKLDDYFLTARLERLTPRTVCDEEGLRKDLRLIRGQGWAYADQEYVVGRRTIAAPIFDRTDRATAAINIAAATDLVPEREMLECYLPQLLQAAAEISRACGASLDCISPPSLGAFDRRADHRAPAP